MEEMHGEKSEPELEISKEEMENLMDALKNEQFRDMLVDYVKEVQDPANVKKYEDEVMELEKERGVKVTFLHPEPGFVIKTSVNGDRKAFVNLCTNSNVAQPSCERAVNNECGDNPQVGFCWSLPYSISPPREDLDRAGRKCVVYDVLFHPNTIQMALANPRFQKVVEGTAMDGLESNFAVKFDRNNVRYPKLKFKGYPTATVIRQFPKGRQTSDGGNNGFVRYPDPKDSWIERAKLAKEKAERKSAAASKNTKGRSDNDKAKNATKPKYVLKYRNEMDIQDFSYSPSGQPAGISHVPKDLVVEVELPLISSAAQVDLDVTEKLLVLTSTKPLAYYLNVSLPHAVDPEEAKAKFDIGTRKLTVTLPVKPMQRHTYNVLPAEKEDNRVSNEKPDNDNVALPEAQLGVGNIRVHCSTREDGTCEKSDLSLVTEISSTAYRTKSECDEDDDDDDEISESVTGSVGDATIIYTPKVPAKSYSLPTYNIRQTKDKIIVVLLERNVNPESVTEDFQENGTKCLVALHSLGSGFVPFNFSICVACPPNKRFNCEEFSCSVEDESAVLIIGKDANCHGDWDVLWVGRDGDQLEERLLITPTNALARLRELEVEELEKASTATESQVHISVLSHSAEKVQIEVQRDVPVATSLLVGETKTSTQMAEADKPEGVPSMAVEVQHEKENAADEIQTLPTKVEEATESQPQKQDLPPNQNVESVPDNAVSIVSRRNTTVKSDASSDDASHDENHDAVSEVVSDPTWAASQRPQKPRQKFRSMSESSTDVHGWKPKGILKLRHFGRSISESGSDDLSWSSQEVISSPDLDIPEESSADEQGLHSKKSVRFNEVVSRTLFRTNSSILGQRKKNQRKQRNKKRASQQGCSETKVGEGTMPSMEQGQETDSDKEPLSPLPRNVLCNVGNATNAQGVGDVVVNGMTDANANANTERTVDNRNCNETVRSSVSTNDDNYVRNKDSYELDENDNAQEGMSTSGDEGSDWQVVKESKRSRERKKKRKVKKDDSRPQTILSWDDRRESMGDENKPQCPVEFSNVVMYDLDD